MKICIIGTGFVGVVSAAVFASFGNHVIGLDVDETKIAKLKKGVVPFYEPGLTELLLKEQASGNLEFTTSYETAIKNSEIIFIAVGTPSAPDGQADLKFVWAVAESLAPYLQEQTIVVVKSTVPPGTLPKLEERIRALTKVQFATAAVPEFLKEGTAVQDTLHPDRIVIGAHDAGIFERLAALHAPLKAPIVKISPESAQMAKYAANAYLATRITFINQIADLCEKNGADVQEIVEAIGYDQRIGDHYWYPGFGYGGSCFPKDVKELAAYSRAIGEDSNLLNKINDLNENRIPKLLDQYEKTVGGWKDKNVAVLGLSFKPNTDDMREAPSLKVIPYLLEKGATIKGYDPKALSTAPMFLQKNEKATYTDKLPEALQGTDVVLALIEWPEITKHDFSTTRLAGKPQWFIDARNQFNKSQLQKMGYTYIGIGRP